MAQGTGSFQVTELHLRDKICDKVNIEAYLRVAQARGVNVAEMSKEEQNQEKALGKLREDFIRERFEDFARGQELVLRIINEERQTPAQRTARANTVIQIVTPGLEPFDAQIFMMRDGTEIVLRPNSRSHLPIAEEREALTDDSQAHILRYIAREYPEFLQGLRVNPVLNSLSIYGTTMKVIRKIARLGGIDRITLI